MSSIVSPARSIASARRGDHARDGVAVDLAALHAQHLLVALGVEHVRLRGVGAEDEAAAADLELAARDDDRAGAVAEEHRGAAVVVVGDARQRLGAADEHDARAAALDLRGGLVERVDEAGARGVDVDRARALGAERERDVRGDARRHAVRRDRRDDDLVDLGGGAAGVLERQRARARGKLGERLVGRDDPALADAGAAHDPLVARVEALDEVGVGDDVLGQRGADAEDPGLQAAAPLRRAVRRRATAARSPWGERAARWRSPPSGRRQGPLDEAGEHGAGAELDEPVDAGGAQGEQRLAPAHGAQEVLGELARGRPRTGAALPLEYTGISIALTGVPSSAARRRSAAGSMSGEWNAPVTSRRRARAPVSSRATSSAASSASTGPDSTSWPGALSLATTRPRRSASARTSRDSPPSIAIMPPARCSPASAMASARSSTSLTASSKWSAPAATRAAYSPSEWPAAAIASPGVVVGVVVLARAPLVPRRDRAQEQGRLLVAGPLGEALERVMAEQVEAALEERMATVGLVHALGVAALAGEEQCDRGRHQGHCTPSDRRWFPRFDTALGVCQTRRTRGRANRPPVDGPIRGSTAGRRLRRGMICLWS